MTTVFTEVQRQRNPGESTSRTSSQESDNTSEESSDTSFVSNAAETVVGPTGAFLQRQSSLNIALGLIMIFTMILAAAVKKKKGSNSDRGRFGGRNSGFQSYSGSSGNSNFGSSREPETGDFGSSDDFNKSDTGFGSSAPELEGKNSGDQGDWKISESEESGDDGVQEESSSETGEDLEEARENPEKYVCEETGEVFDTKSGLKMHKQINGIE